MGAFEFTPDGRRLVVTAEVWPERGADPACNRKKDETAEKGKMKAHLADRLLFRHWDAWEDGKRTHLLLHIVDVAPFDEGVDPVAQAKAIVAELKKYDAALYDKPRWLVLNKLDMVAADERAAKVKDFVKRFKWKGPVFEISALTREGCESLIKAIYQHIHAQQQSEQPVQEVDPRFVEPAPEL